MQAIARVNRVFKDKPGGLVVDNIGIAAELKQALRIYTDAKGRGQPTVKAEDALKILKEKLDVVRGMMHGFDYSKFERKPLRLLAPAANHLLSLDDGKKAVPRCDGVGDQSLFPVRHARRSGGTAHGDRLLLRHSCRVGEARQRRQEAFRGREEFRAKAEPRQRDPRRRRERHLRAGCPGETEHRSLSDEFLEDVRKTPLKNLAIELLDRLLKDEIRSHSRTNLVQEKKYSDRLLAILAKYHNRAIETAQVIEELIAMAKDFQAALKRNEDLGLNADEIAFYDALAEKPKVLPQMGDETWKKLAVELTVKLRSSTMVDWQVRASMRIMIKRLLRKYKYPPDGQEAAVAMVLKQAKALAEAWSGRLSLI